MPGTVAALRKEKARGAIALEGDRVTTIEHCVHVVAKFLLAGEQDRSGLRTTVERDNAAERDGRLKGLLGARGRRSYANYGFRVAYVDRLQRQTARGRLLGHSGRCR